MSVSEPPGTSSTGPHDTVIEASALSARYGSRHIWTGATFEIAAGEMIAVLGPNGAGKSTLLRMLLGLVPPAAGRLMVLGRPPRRGDRSIGYVPQHRAAGAAVPVAGRELVRLGVDGDRWGLGLRAHRSAGAAVEDVLGCVDALPYADRRLTEMSGGERQRLLLAQALVGDPRLLLLDEPLAGLDLRNQAAITALVSGIAARLRMTVLLVAHDVNPLLPYVSRILYVAEGRLTIGAPGDVLTSETLTNLYRSPVEVLRDTRGRVHVVGLEDEHAHPHGP